MKRIGFALCACVVLAGCETSPEDQLIGAWECESSEEGMSMEFETNYASGGRSSASFDLTLNEGADTIEMNGTMTGSWELKEDQLTEDVKDLTILSTTVNGQSEINGQVVDDIPAIKQMVSRIEDAIKGQVGTSEVKLLDEDSLIVEYRGETTSCDRA